MYIISINGIRANFSKKGNRERKLKIFDIIIFDVELKFRKKRVKAMFKNYNVKIFIR